MSQTPEYLRPPHIAAIWRDRRIAASYRHRPQYPAETFEILAELMVDRPRAVLDLGAGTGNVARILALLVDWVDAVDPSEAMIDVGRRLPGGDHPAITWIVGRAEEVELRPPYALATAGDSLHWMDWTVVLPRLADVLSPHGMFAILDVNGDVVGDTEALRRARQDLLQRYATYRRPTVNLVEEMERRGLFREEGRRETEAVPLLQSVDDYVEAFHAHVPHARERMAPADVAAFDAALRTLMLDHMGETVELAVRGFVLWGKPLRPEG